MRGDTERAGRAGRAGPRGEAGRVAARVRALLDEAEGCPDDEPPGSARGDRPQHVAPSASAADERRPPSAARVSTRNGSSRVERLLTRVPVRLDPGRRAALAVGIAVVLAALVTGVWLVSTRPQAVPVGAGAPVVPSTSPLVASSPAGRSSSAVRAPSSAPTQIVVDVAGKVRHPGVYRLPNGSRVDDALTAAGGPIGHLDLSRLNLAALLVDGQQVAVGVPAAADAVAPTSGTSGAGVAGGSVNLNTATLEQLETLPGVGPVLAQDILDYRSAHGSFSSVDQLQDVTGIGDVKYAALKSRVSV